MGKPIGFILNGYDNPVELYTSPTDATLPILLYELKIKAIEQHLLLPVQLESRFCRLLFPQTFA